MHNKILTIKKILLTCYRTNRPCPNHPITLSDKGLKVVQTPSNDPVMVLVMIINFEIQKILVDNGSTVDILFYKAF